jgi:hypothetical protein
LGNTEFYFSLLILVSRTPWTNDQPLARPLPTHKHIINADKHPCLDLDSNPRSQCSRELRHFIPETARPTVIGHEEVKYVLILTFHISNHVRDVFFNLCGGTLGPAAITGLLYQRRMIGDGDCGEIGGMKIRRGNRSTRRKPAPAPLLSVTKSHMTRPGFEPGPPRWEAGDFINYLILLMQFFQLTIAFIFLGPDILLNICSKTFFLQYQSYSFIPA